MPNLTEEKSKLTDESELEKSESLASIVKRLGNPESTTLLHSPCNVFQISQIDGVIGYHQIGNCAVVIGDPICLPQDIAELTKAFHLHCQECDLKTVYLLAYHDFAHWAIQQWLPYINSSRLRIKYRSNQFSKKTKIAMED